jgi:hypothetical protein
MGEKRNVHKILAGKPEGTRLFRRTRRGWEDNIRTDLREIVWEIVDCIYMCQYRDYRWALINTAISLK